MRLQLRQLRDEGKLPSRLAMKAFASSLGRNKTFAPKEKMMAEMISHDYDISDEKYLRPILEYLEYLKKLK